MHIVWPTTGHGVSSLASLTGACQGWTSFSPSFSSALTGYYKEELISHVKDWPAEVRSVYRVNISINSGFTFALTKYYKDIVVNYYF